MPKRTKWKHARSFREYLAASLLNQLGMTSHEADIRAVCSCSEVPFALEDQVRRGRSRWSDKQIKRFDSAIVELKATIP